MGIQDWFSFKKNKGKKTQEELAEIRRTFATRINHFKRLIQANTRAHEQMAELEEALRGFQPYGMQYVRALCTRLSASIFQMIQHLDSLNPKTYEKLFDIFDTLQSTIHMHISPVSHAEENDLILEIHSIGRDHADMCGPKMAMLGEAANNLNMKVPTGFVVTAAAYRLFMKSGGLNEEIDRQIQGTNFEDMESMIRLSSRIMQLIIETSIPESLSQSILDSYDDLCERHGKAIKIAVRSSALGEDLEGAAFAGQYRSILNVDRESLLPAYKEVLASKYSQQAMAYRFNRGIRDDDVALCVGCMVMVEAHASGVAYSRNPINIRDKTLSLYSIWGLPRAVVNGSMDTDEFLVARLPAPRILKRHIADKKEIYVCDKEEGLCRISLTEKNRTQPSLTDKQILLIAKATMRIEEYFGLPQDVEWAITESGQLSLLQCRPLLLAEHKRGLLPPDSTLPPPILSGGRTASPGIGTGPVYMVAKDVDTLLFPDGGVLVLNQALPNRAALLGRCSAVISEQGGAAGHLANVAREFGIPALFGLKNAQKKLFHGQIVTVDAEGCAVYNGRVEAFLEKKPRERIMRGSPVQKSLRKAAKYIVRLHLIDPDAFSFKPGNCKTLHDIMRFCHEMAVREMFEFGMNKDYIEGASRQLICNVPKQFWVLNLDSGIAPEGKHRADRCVLLEHIRSIPMCALWAGMDAIPWEGPPPVHTQGLMSVMFEATVNTDLNPTAPSRFSQKNYFMISENYCILQSRFGFHFCGVEALVSDRNTENYASLQFKGGAANLERRILRARFIGDILAEFDFRVRIKEDTLFARLEGLGRPQMEHRLKILGYLITHTRQLDMIMTNTDEVTRQRDKFFRDFTLFDLKE